MRIMVVGTGYVGLVTGTCLAEIGNQVVCVDVDSKKIGILKEGGIPIYEPGLEELVNRNIEAGRLSFTTKIQDALQVSDICFIAVGTPMGEDGSADLQYVLQVAEEIGAYMVHPVYVIDKSTVPVGTAQKVREKIQGELEKRGSTLTFDVISNPEFLKEGTAIEDCMNPDRVVVGTDNKEAARVMRELYLPLVKQEDRILCMDLASAEMTKYTANAMLATKISFINEIANLCERVGADVNQVRLGIGNDKRIGFSFLAPGCGYGGSCFPKDVQALIKTSEVLGYPAKILRAVEEVNQEQKQLLAKKVVKRFGEVLDGKVFAIWGLAFKPDTDDMRQAAAIPLIEELTKRGAFVQAYDPKAKKEAQLCYLKGNSNIIYCDNKYQALDGADAMLLVTEWEEFRVPDFLEVKRLLKTPVIFDGRNQYNKNQVEEFGFEYYQIGVAK